MNIGLGHHSSKNDMKNADKLIKGIWSFARRIVEEDKADVLEQILDILQPPPQPLPLYFLSTEAGSVNCFEVLVNSGRLESSENIWRKGLHRALEHTNLNTPQIVEILLAKDKNIVNEKDYLTGGTALHVLMLKWRSIDRLLRSNLLKILLQHGADPSIKDRYGRIPLDELLTTSAGMEYDEAKPLIAGAVAASEQKDGSVSTDSEQKLPDTGIAAEQHGDAASQDSEKGQEGK